MINYSSNSSSFQQISQSIVDFNQEYESFKVDLGVLENQLRIAEIEMQDSLENAQDDIITSNELFKTKYDRYCLLKKEVKDKRIDFYGKDLKLGELMRISGSSRLLLFKSAVERENKLYQEFQELDVDQTFKIKDVISLNRNEKDTLMQEIKDMSAADFEENIIKSGDSTQKFREYFSFKSE